MEVYKILEKLKPNDFEHFEGKVKIEKVFFWKFSGASVFESKIVLRVKMLKRVKMLINVLCW
jgi:hypothetical protein